MNSVDAMAIEIEYQLEVLTKLELPRQAAVNNCVIIGSGDSYVAGLIAQYASDYRAICCNPLDVVNNPKIITNRQIFIVSVSGNTNANILVAKIAKEKKVQTTAITAKPKSKLAKNCDEIIELKFKSTNVPTAGTIAFTSSMLACLSLVRKVNGLPNLDSIFKQVNHEIENSFSRNKKLLRYHSSSFILGSGILFPIALYGALKINEVIGSKSLAYPLEEFFHSPVFSARANDDIILLAGPQDKSDKKFKITYEKLREINFSTLLIDCSRESVTDSLLKAIFFLQLFVLKQAQKRGMKDCYFLRNKKLLRVSSDLIYRNYNKFYKY